MAVAQAPTDQDESASDVDDAADLSADYQPRRVNTLFVGESSPADSHFYRANSNLFRAVHAAFAMALGEAVPSGEAFLRSFMARGFWLVDLVDRPLADLPVAERKAVLGSGVAKLAQLLAETKPKHVIAIKADIAPSVERAVELAALRKPPTVLALRYPLRQYRADFVTRLSAFLAKSL
jgi:hypothetical protein